MAETHFDAWTAEHLETLWPELFEPAVIDEAVSVLAELAGAGRALELGIGSGRLALPLHRRGIDVHGIELSTAMVDRLRKEPDSPGIDVTIGDFATTKVEGTFALAYLVRNTITNLTSQAEQVACFRNVADHLEPGGHFVIENYVPELRRLPPGESMHVFTATSTHVGLEEYDVVSQIAVSHHYWVIDGELRTLSSPHRYVWPSELDLMAQMAGMTLQGRWAGWKREPFDGDSRSHVSIWDKPV